eukprot:GHVT01056572.1.p2 GENE.GHVT01056572.1~~GHVT01056572.1.p2  ORF type:complete len:144 (+),score=2.92 GHVT01056572.1:309-740(+)
MSGCSARYLAAILSQTSSDLPTTPPFLGGGISPRGGPPRPPLGLAPLSLLPPLPLPLAPSGAGRPWLDHPSSSGPGGPCEPVPALSGWRGLPSLLPPSCPFLAEYTVRGPPSLVPPFSCSNCPDLRSCNANKFCPSPANDVDR